MTRMFPLMGNVCILGVSVVDVCVRGLPVFVAVVSIIRIRLYRSPMLASTRNLVGTSRPSNPACTT